MFLNINVTNPAAAGTNVVAQFTADADVTAWASITQPDVVTGRGIQVVFSADWDGGNIEVTGLRADGTHATETITAVQATTVQGTVGYLKIDRVKNTGTRTAGTADVEYSAALALPAVGGGTAAIVAAYEISAGGRIADGTLSGTLYNPGPTYPPNGTRDYFVGYTIAKTYTDAGHTHS